MVGRSSLRSCLSRLDIHLKNRLVVGHVCERDDVVGHGKARVACKQLLVDVVIVRPYRDPIEKVGFFQSTNCLQARIDCLEIFELRGSKYSIGEHNLVNFFKYIARL